MITRTQYFQFLWISVTNFMLRHQGLESRSLKNTEWIRETLELTAIDHFESQTLSEKLYKNMLMKYESKVLRG